MALSNVHKSAVPNLRVISRTTKIWHTRRGEIGNYGMRARGVHEMTTGHCLNSWGSGGRWKPPAGPGQSPGGGPGGGAPGSS